MSLLVVHIAGGTVALAAGAAALYVRKGGRAHAKAGTVFFGSIMVLLASGLVMAVAQSIPNVAVGAVFGAYLVATSWAAARRRDGTTGRFELGALLVVVGCAIVDILWGLEAMGSATGRVYGYPPTPYFVSAAVETLAAGLDLNYLLRSASPARRIARHLWRMCAALLFTTFSFFVGQQKVMPASWHGSPWLLIPPLAVLGLMVFWLLRVRFSTAFALASSAGHEPRGPDRVAQTSAAARA